MTEIKGPYDNSVPEPTDRSYRAEPITLTGWPLRWAEAIVRARVAEAEVERLREALQRIADGEIDGVGNYSECVQLYAQAYFNAR